MRRSAKLPDLVKKHGSFDKFLAPCRRARVFVCDSEQGLGELHGGGGIVTALARQRAAETDRSFYCRVQQEVITMRPALRPLALQMSDFQYSRKPCLCHQ